MKIRTGFVTNSSSSSYIAISITSEKLAEILKKYEEELADYFDFCEFSEEECSINGLDLDENVPSELDDVMDTLIEFLSEATNCWLDEDEEMEIQEDDEPFVQMIKELIGQKTKLLASIKKVDWSCESYGWGGDSDIRMFESSYSEEILKEIYAKIAKEKGCSVDEVTGDDFSEYASERTGTQREHFTYRKRSKTRGGKGEYTASYELTD